LTVTADDKVKIINTPLPPLTVSYAGFVNGETPASLTTQPTAETTATAESPAGQYPITAGGGASGDYTLEYVAGTLYVIEHPAPGKALVYPDPLRPGTTVLEITGTSRNDVILVKPGKNPGDVKVTFNNKLLGTYQPTGRILIHGGFGNDHLEMSQRITLDAWLYGDAGNDQLFGGHGMNLLMGGAGKDQLWGGRGPGMLIGGPGTDSLRSWAGDNILIGSTTAYDANDAALMAILDLWKTTPVADRVAALAAGAYPLTGQTVYKDWVTDSLFGGTGNDLFFKGPGDHVTKGKKRPTIVAIT
jgi:Ca2+-binding RTX toxin-like protein